MRTLRHSSSSPSSLPFLESSDKGLYLLVRVQPKAKLNAVMLSDSKEVLKVKLTSAPIDGKANKALIKLLAKFFKINKSSIKITSGLKSRNKRIKITDIEPQEIETALKK